MAICDDVVGSERRFMPISNSTDNADRKPFNPPPKARPPGPLPPAPRAMMTPAPPRHHVIPLPAHPDTPALARDGSLGPKPPFDLTVRANVSILHWPRGCFGTACKTGITGALGVVVWSRPNRIGYQHPSEQARKPRLPGASFVGATGIEQRTAAVRDLCRVKAELGNPLTVVRSPKPTTPNTCTH